MRTRTLCRVRAAAWGLLGSIPRLKRAVSVSVKNGENTVTITVQPAGQGAGPGAPPPEVGGRFLSDAEAAIVNALKAAQGVPLLGKVLAARCGREYETKFKYLLENLEAREVIDGEQGRGYLLKAAKKPAAEADE